MVNSAKILPADTKAQTAVIEHLFATTNAQQVPKCCSAAELTRTTPISNRDTKTFKQV